MELTHDQKKLFMLEWCTRNGLLLTLQGECGFGRECVGVLSGDIYPDYDWYDEEYNSLGDPDVWVPPDAYHKHPCVAVLGRGEHAEDQLYQWLKWFDENGFVCEAKSITPPPDLGPFGYILGKDKQARMVRKADILKGHNT